MPNPQDNTLFIFLKQITETKDKNFIDNLPEEKRKALNPFIINLWLSMNENLLPLASYLNKYVFNMDLRKYYHICRTIIPKHKAWFQWLKYEKKKKDGSYPKWLIELIVREYEFISKKEAKEYATLLIMNKGIIDIALKYPLEDKEKKELYKLCQLEMPKIAKSTMTYEKQEKVEKKDDFDDMFE